MNIIMCTPACLPTCSERNHSSCQTLKLKGFTEIWGWVQYADFSGTVKFRHLDLNLWSYDVRQLVLFG